jgi:hypothetical protein
MKSTFLVVGLVVGVGTQAGCGSGGGASCTSVPPCGGSVVGTWKVVAACIDQAALDMTVSAACPQASASQTLHETGTITFNDDLTFTETLSASATLVENLPPACLARLTCADLNALGQPTAPQPGATMSVSCTGAPTCTCRFSTKATNLVQTGTYATSGTTMTVTPSGDTAQNDTFCVQGNTLYLRSAAMTASMGAMGPMTVPAEAVLKRL